MATTKLQGNTIHLDGQFIAAGAMAPQIALTKGDLSTFTLDDCKGKHVVMNIFPSIDTGICATSVRKFNQLAASLPNTIVLCISRDLPFAQGRFCAAEGIENVITLSDFHRHSTFGVDYGVQMADGPLADLLARAIVVVAPDGKVSHAELVPEIKTEPNYEAAIDAIKAK
jgi:thiol peroxidase